jgi:tyrosyl-DNA phosphodiesterase 1
LTSSIGRLNQKFLDEFCAQFHPPALTPIQQKLNIMFPTEEHVEDSHLGVPNASSMILPAKNWDDTKDFPKTSFCKQEARTPKLNGNLYHAKYLVASRKDTNGHVIDDDTLLYFGSHNLSAAAWGNMEKQGSQISIANWELGVVFPPEEGSADLKRKIIESLPLKVLPSPKRYDLKIDRPFIMEKQEVYRNL